MQKGPLFQYFSDQHSELQSFNPWSLTSAPNSFHDSPDIPTSLLEPYFSSQESTNSHMDHYYSNTSNNSKRCEGKLYFQPRSQRKVPPIPLHPTQRGPPPTGRNALPKLLCTLCKRNGEPPEVYTTHILKDLSGIVVCPILRKYKCPICQYPGGDDAHTMRFCPLNPNPEARYSKSIVTLLKEKANTVGKIVRSK